MAEKKSRKNNMESGVMYKQYIYPTSPLKRISIGSTNEPIIMVAPGWNITQAYFDSYNSPKEIGRIILVVDQEVTTR